MRTQHKSSKTALVKPGKQPGEPPSISSNPLSTKQSCRISVDFMARKCSIHILLCCTFLMSNPSHFLLFSLTGHAIPQAGILPSEGIRSLAQEPEAEGFCFLCSSHTLEIPSPSISNYFCFTS